VQALSEAATTSDPNLCSSTEKEAGTKRSPFTDLLNSTNIEKPKLKVTTGKARVLTSAECLKALEEKKNEERHKAEEKEQRKLERIEKKQREEELKKKQEERAQRKEQMCRKRKGSKSDHSQSVAKCPSPGLDIDASNHSSTCPGASRRTRKSAEYVDDEIDVNRCCVCFGSFTEDVGTGREWLQYKCTRWIHEECINDNDVNIGLSKLRMPTLLRF